METNEIYAVQELYEENLLIVHNISEKFAMGNLHFHDGYEILLTLSDQTTFCIENSFCNLNRGGIALVDSNDPHRVIGPEEGVYERYIISFVPEYIMEFERDGVDLFKIFTNHSQGSVASMQLSDIQLEEFITQVKVLERLIAGERYGKEMLKKLALAQLVIMCNGYFKDSESPEMVYSSERLQPILYYIKEHIAEDLRLDFISEKFYISKSHLIRLFKTVTGMTPNEYIIMVRMMKARSYLVEGMPILSICEKIGYSDESHFIRMFKKVMGITPKQYGIKKKELKGEEEI